MLWYKSWLDTRWRFLIGLGLLTLSAAGTVLVYPKVLALMPLVPPVDAGGEIGRQIREAAELSRSYGGYVWSQWFRQNLLQAWTLFAVLIGTGGLVTQSSRGGAIFTLSLPVSRPRLLRIRAATGLAELFVLAIVPSLAITLLSPAVGQSYGLGSVLTHGVCLFFGGAVFFSIAFLLSTVFTDVWPPLLLSCALAAGLAMFHEMFRDLSRYSIFAVMNGEVYFRSGGLPWLGLLASSAVSALMLYAAETNMASRDF